MDKVKTAQKPEESCQETLRTSFFAALREDEGKGADAQVLAIFSDGKDSWDTSGVAADILQACVQCIIDGLEWKLRGARKH